MLTGQSVPRKRRTTAFFPFQSVAVCVLPAASARAASVASAESWSSDRPDSLENSVAPMPTIAAWHDRLMA